MNKNNLRLKLTSSLPITSPSEPHHIDAIEIVEHYLFDMNSLECLDIAVEELFIRDWVHRTANRYIIKPAVIWGAIARVIVRYRHLKLFNHLRLYLELEKLGIRERKIKYFVNAEYYSHILKYRSDNMCIVYNINSTTAMSQLQMIRIN